MSTVYLSVPKAQFNQFKSNILPSLTAGYKGSVGFYLYDYNEIYSLARINECNAIALYLDGRWNGNLNQLPPGCKAELTHALNLGKEVYIIYKSQQYPEYRLYKAAIDGTLIKTLGGTVAEIKTFLEESGNPVIQEQPKTQIEESVTVHCADTQLLDKRILLRRTR